MPELANFPHISQRDADVNADWDCVPASVAMSLEYLTGRKFTAQQIKDTVYGAGYVGGTAASAYVDYSARQGVLLAPVNGNGAQLVAAIKAAISAGRPAILTEPDPYMPAQDGYSHVCAAYKFSNDSMSITVVDPWIDQDVTKSDSTWADILQFNQIWTLEKMERNNWLSTHQQGQAEDTWKSTTKGAIAAGGNAPASIGIFESGQTPSYETGIARAWQHEYQNGRNYGPPVSYEYGQVDGQTLTDWNGTPIIQQNFLGGRCEWDIKSGTAHWYSWQ